MTLTLLSRYGILVLTFTYLRCCYDLGILVLSMIVPFVLH